MYPGREVDLDNLANLPRKQYIESEPDEDYVKLPKTEEDVIRNRA